MHDEQHNVFFIAETHQERTQERSARQIEGSSRFCGRQVLDVLLTPGCRYVAQVDKRQVERRRRYNPLYCLPILFVERRAQTLVALQHPGQALL